MPRLLLTQRGMKGKSKRQHPPTHRGVKSKSPKLIEPWDGTTLWSLHHPLLRPQTPEGARKPPRNSSDAKSMTSQCHQLPSLGFPGAPSPKSNPVCPVFVLSSSLDYILSDDLHGWMIAFIHIISFLNL